MIPTPASNITIKMIVEIEGPLFFSFLILHRFPHCALFRQILLPADLCRFTECVHTCFPLLAAHHGKVSACVRHTGDGIRRPREVISHLSFVCSCCSFTYVSPCASWLPEGCRRRLPGRRLPRRRLWYRCRRWRGGAYPAGLQSQVQPHLTQKDFFLPF